MSETKAPVDPGGGQTETTRGITIDDLRLTATAPSEEKSSGPREFLFAWFQLFRTAQIHSIDNQALRRPIGNFIEITTKTLSRDGSVAFQGKDGTLFFNSIKINLSTEEYGEAAEPIFEFFAERGMGGFVMEGSLDEEAVCRLLSILVQAPPAERSFATIEAKLRAEGLRFRINKPLGAGKSDAAVVLERRAYTFLTYSKLVVLYRSLLAENEANLAKRHYLVKKIARTIEALVDICSEDDHTFLGVAAVKSAEDYPSHHAANMAVLSVALGDKLGLEKASLADLGMSAVFCDFGLKHVPRVVLEKGDALEAPERESLERHTLQSVKFLLAEKHYTKPLLRRILVAFEHHRQVDGGGYPRLAHPPDLFSRIVSIADAYDALTTERQWRKAFLPDEALGMMLSDSGKKYDPLLLKIFVNTLGLYPVGTVVRLSSGELAVVVFGGGEGERLAHPIVALVGPDGKPNRTVDLAEKDASGRYLREIASSEDPAKYGLMASALFSQSPAP